MNNQGKSRRCLDASDRSKLTTRRSKKLLEQARATTERCRELRKHDWQSLAVGRVCRNCFLTQADDEFDDEPVCVAS
jgi:hypothetical protein